MTDKEKLDMMKKLADAMYYAAQYLTTDASRLRKAMDAYHRFIITEYNKQDPASEDSQDSELPDGWKEKGVALFTQIRVIPTILSTIQGHSQYIIQADANDEEVLLACPNFPCSVISKVKIVPCE